jgi:putative DNA primase/helicase
LLHGARLEDGVQWARAWLATHEGFGSLAHGAAHDEDAEQSAGDAERTAYIEERWSSASPITTTPAETYLASRGLAPVNDDLKVLRWLPNARGFGDESEGAMIAAFTDNSGALVAIQLTYLAEDGTKSKCQPVRVTLRGPHDWGRRGLVRFGGAGTPTAAVVEGVEDALSLREAGVERVLALCGLARLGKVVMPFEVESVVVVRDADPPESPATASLWRGVTKLACQLPGRGKLCMTARPDTVALAPPHKDANDLLSQGVDKVDSLVRTASRTPLITEFERSAVLATASLQDNDSYENGRDRIAKLLGWRVGGLDKARKQRIEELANAERCRFTERDERWPDPVPDVAPLLDEIIAEVSRYVVAPNPMFDTVALWCAFTHLVQRDDLGVYISPRLAIQAPDRNCGKTVLLEAIACAVPRQDMVLSTSASSIFRSVDVDKNTLLIDEVDLLLKDDRNPELHAVLNGGHRRSTARVKRVERRTDGSFDPTTYNCFTAVALAGIKRLPPTLQDRSIVIFLQRAVAGEVREHLVNSESEALMTLRRKLARWAEDLRALPAVDRPQPLSNRKGDNWYPLRQIAALAGGDWPARAMAAALGAVSAHTAPGGALTELLDGVWRVFDEKRRVRLHTAEIVADLLEMDEGKWRQVDKGKSVSAYYLRETLGDVMPDTPELSAARRWREGANTRFGYTIDHLREPWRRYLGKKPPGEGDDSAKAQGPQDEPAQPQEPERPGAPACEPEAPEGRPRDGFPPWREDEGSATPDGPAAVHSDSIVGADEGVAAQTAAEASAASFPRGARGRSKAGKGAAS